MGILSAPPYDASRLPGTRHHVSAPFASIAPRHRRIRTSINAGLAALAAQGLVTTAPDPHHAVHRAVLTAEGRAWLDDHRDDPALDLWGYG